MAGEARDHRWREPPPVFCLGPLRSGVTSATVHLSDYNRLFERSLYLSSRPSKRIYIYTYVQIYVYIYIYIYIYI